MLESLKQMENVTVINELELKTIKGGATDDRGQPDCWNSSNNKNCSHV